MIRARIISKRDVSRQDSLVSSAVHRQVLLVYD